MNDRIFSTTVECNYTIPLPASIPLAFAALPTLGIDFEKIAASVECATLETFATHNSASVQATLYQMCERILKEEKHVMDITYKLPNKVTLHSLLDLPGELGGDKAQKGGQMFPRAEQS